MNTNIDNNEKIGFFYGFVILFRYLKSRFSKVTMSDVNKIMNPNLKIAEDMQKHELHVKVQQKPYSFKGFTIKETPNISAEAKDKKLS